MSAPLRDPRTFRLGRHPDRPTGPGCVSVPKSDQVLADILRGVVLGESVPDDQMEHYLPGDLIVGRMPAGAAAIYLARGQLEVVQPEAAPPVVLPVKTERAKKGGK